jgi:YidC/Oxa1 family membrane protein insertase
MDKKTIILLVVLGALVLAYWPLMEWLGFYKPAPPQSKAVQPDSTTQVDTTKVTPPQPVPVVPAGDAAVLSSPIVATVDSLPPDTVTITTGKYVVTLSSLGGGPVSIKLREYRYRDHTPIEMLPETREAVPSATFAGGTFSTAQQKFQCSLRPGAYDATSSPLEITYTLPTASGGAIMRTFRFSPAAYDYQFIQKLVQPQKMGFERQYNLIWNNPLGVTEEHPATDHDAMEAVAMMSGSREKLADFQDNKLNQTLTGTTTWAGVRAKYFAAILIPRGESEANAVFANGTLRAVASPKGKYTEKKITVGLDMSLSPAAEATDSFTVFVGPLDYTLMAEYGIGLEDMLDIGTSFIGWIIKPFALAVIWLLPRMYQVIPNYGFVIIVFAAIVKLITLPLSLKSFKSMNAMKELQPKLEELKKKHKNNPQELNSATMKLYKEHGVNPFSGCLPVLLQMPLFFALFSVFRSTILLREAPWFWFFTDLSRGASSLTDPYMILVVAMVGFQFLSQRLTMASNQQNKMLMYMMPLIMGFFFYSVAAGLVLYWTCFSAFSMVDWYIFRRRQPKNPQVMTT